jgi:hypothetical protein
VRTFETLHGVVSKAIGPIHGVGKLMVYDTALRIGAYRRLSPNRVFLHADVREGAKALGLDSRPESLPMSTLPAALRNVAPAEAEDILCIYSSRFADRRFFLWDVPRTDAAGG